VQNYATLNPNPIIKIFFNNGEQGASAARNMGIKNSSGTLIAIIDDDVVLNSTWAEEIIKTFEDKSIVATTGPAYPLWAENARALWFPRELHWIISCTSWCSWDTIRDVRNVWLENSCFRKEVFGLVGMLNTKLGPQDSVMGFKGREITKGIISEEVELSLRIKEKTGGRIIYNPKIVVNHRVQPQRLKLSYIIRWSFWTGYSKKLLKKLTTTGKQKEMTSEETVLLNQIITGLLPRTVFELKDDPITAIKKLSITTLVLLMVAVGFASGSFKRS
jgi:GT2 family glycosyltransferase